MSRGGIIACMVLTLLTPVGLLLIHLARGNAEEVEHLYSRGFYHGMATVLTALTGRVPFSVMEVILLLLGAAALVFLVFWIRGSHPAGKTLVAGMLKAAVDHSFGGFGGILLVYSYRGS